MYDMIWFGIGIGIDYYNVLVLIMTLKLASGSYDGTIKFWDPSTGTNNPN